MGDEILGEERTNSRERFGEFSSSSLLIRARRDPDLVRLLGSDRYGGGEIESMNDFYLILLIENCGGREIGFKQEQKYSRYRFGVLYF